jgi:ribosomal protein L29
MKTKDFKDLRTKDLGALRKMADDKKQEAIKVKMSAAGSKEKNPKLGLTIRREIAKILTLVREKEILESLAPKVEKEKAKE